MSERILTAIIAPVKIGTFEIEGLLDENQDFAVAIPQLVALNLIPPNRSIKQLESLLCIAFQTHRKLKTSIHPKAVNALGLPDVEKLLFKQALAGNKNAVVLCEAFIGLSLKQLFSDAFKIKFEEEERQEYLEERLQHCKQFHPLLTSWLKLDADGDSKKVNWGKEINLFKIAAKLPLRSVNEYTRQELRTLNNAEVTYNAMRKIGMSHGDALNTFD